MAVCVTWIWRSATCACGRSRWGNEGAQRRGWITVVCTYASNSLHTEVKSHSIFKRSPAALSFELFGGTKPSHQAWLGGSGFRVARRVACSTLTIKAEQDTITHPLSPHRPGTWTCRIPQPPAPQTACMHNSTPPAAAVAAACSERDEIHLCSMVTQASLPCLPILTLHPAQNGHPPSAGLAPVSTPSHHHSSARQTVSPFPTAAHPIHPLT